MTTNYNGIETARDEMINFLDSINEHHPTRSLIEKSIKNLDIVLTLKDKV